MNASALWGKGRVSKYGRWCGNLSRFDGPKGRVQIEHAVRDAASGRTPLQLPEELLRLAQAEYDRQYSGQPYERMQERGGLGLLEVVGLLADALERHGGLPSVPAKKEGDRWAMPEPPKVPSR